ncbi:twitching motility protein PilT [Pararhizobium polonicum]|uniref:Twitching motility protein PilT n=1 Tax=Pararhizobium polonicum TaxID=1612624 RepID=A0A1C7NW22_9HYPH|nr:type II toxin-antitoxin system VapC family toxin [Pararhizobium polonicum]OBZ93200.1 twitching motility protein PilT [Pararhizobium polonicum]
MNLLLDTHVAIWAISSPEMLSSKIKAILRDPANQTYVSTASIWEISIKFMVGRDKAMPFSGYEAIRHFTNAGSRILDITAEHAAATEKVVTAHADPFDRLLIAQAITEPLALVTRDRNVAAYSPTFITW